jgi:hypothetical protein
VKRDSPQRHEVHTKTHKEDLTQGKPRREEDPTPSRKDAKKTKKDKAK